MGRIRSERISLPLWWRLILYTIGFILFALQLAIFFFSIFFYNDKTIYLGWTYFLSLAIGVISCLFVIRRNMNANYKLIWCILFLIFPIPFSTLYFINSICVKASKYSYKKHQYQLPALSDSDTLEELKTKDLRAYNMVKSLKRSEPLALYKNIDVTYFKDALDKHKDMLEELKNAKKYIYMEYFIISAGKLMDELYKVLKEKGEEGIEIKIIYDDLGSKGFLNRKLIKALKKIPNCSVESYARVALNLLVNYRDHRKICIIDGYISYTGGDNLADEYIHLKERFGYWRDTSVKFKGDIAISYTNMFLSTWCRIRKEKLKEIKEMTSYKGIDNGYILPIWDGPTNGDTPGYDMVCQLIESAKKYIYISTPYFVIDDALISLIVRKIKSGVDVKILMPHHPDKKTAFYMGRLNYRDIYNAGGKIYEYEKGFNHAKNIIVDDKYAFSGTINMDYRSLFLHYECGALLINNDEILKMKEDFLNQLDISILFDYKNWNRKKWYQKVIGYIFSLFAPMF